MTLVRRPFTALTAVGTGAHHAFEMRSGVGLVFEPFLGRGVSHGRLVVVHHRVAAGRLIAGQAKRVEREGIRIGGGLLLLQQAAQHPDLHRVEALHAPGSLAAVTAEGRLPARLPGRVQSEPLQSACRCRRRRSGGGR